MMKRTKDYRGGKRKSLTMNHKVYLNDHEGWVFIYWDEFPKRDDKEEEKDGDKEKT